MQRDMEYIRELLLKIEAAPDAIESSNRLISIPRNETEIQKLWYHLGMLVDDVSFVSAIDAHHEQGQEWLNMQLTWQGHEFLDTVRDPEVWARTKEGAKKAGNFAIGFVFDPAKAYGKHIAKERLGIDIS
jgi:hypothetical protein